MDDIELRTRVGVGDLLATYQFLADHGKLSELSALFLPDAVYVTNTEELVGRDEIAGFFRRTAEAFLSTDFLPARHYLSSVYIEPRPDGSAATYACFQFVGTAGLDHWGTYRDQVVRTDDGFRFARRKATVEGHVPGSPAVAVLGLAATGRTG